MIEMRTVSGAIAYDSQLNYFYIFFISRTTMEAEEAALIALVTATAAMVATAAPAAGAQPTSFHLTSLSAS